MFIDLLKDWKYHKQTYSYWVHWRDGSWFSFNLTDDGIGLNLLQNTLILLISLSRYIHLTHTQVQCIWLFLRNWDPQDEFVLTQCIKCVLVNKVQILLCFLAILYLNVHL